MYTQPIPIDFTMRSKAAMNAAARIHRTKLTQLVDASPREGYRSTSIVVTMAINDEVPKDVKHVPITTPTTLVSLSAKEKKTQKGTNGGYDCQIKTNPDFVERRPLFLLAVFILFIEFSTTPAIVIVEHPSSK